MTIVFEPTDTELAIASDWHGGQGSMLYAIASTGALSFGTRRPWRMYHGAWQECTDDEWRYSLLSDLRRELYDVGSTAHLADCQGGAGWECDYSTEAVYAFEERVSDMLRELDDRGVEV